MRKKVSGIYCIENISTSKKYIGLSTDITKRWQKHINALNAGTHHNDYLQHAWNKYGENDFRFYVIEECSNKELDDKEIYYINLFNTLNDENGYNLKSGGLLGGSINEVTRLKLSDSVKKSYENGDLRTKRSETTKKYWENPENKKRMLKENNVMYGKHHTDESKRKISETKKKHHIVSPRRNTTKVYCEELNKVFRDATAAKEELGLDSSSILKACRGEYHTCGGYHWHFIYDDLEK